MSKQPAAAVGTNKPAAAAAASSTKEEDKDKEKEKEKEPTPEEAAIAAGAADPKRENTTDQLVKEILMEREESGSITEEEKTRLSDLRNKGVPYGKVEEKKESSNKKD